MRIYSLPGRCVGHISWRGIAVVGCLFSVLTGCGAIKDAINGQSDPKITPPVISTQPANVSVQINQSASFSVTATGTAPLAYQWSKNGNPIDGAASATFTLAAPQLSDDQAKFAVTVSNPGGSISSSAAILSVTLPPIGIKTQPAGGSYFVNESAMLSVEAYGSSPIFQWQKNGGAIAGATAATYTTPPLAASDDNASFTVVVSNASGSVTSSPAVLRVGPFATPYTTQQGAKLSLYAWPGQKMAILTASNTLDPGIMRKYLTAADGTWNYYSGAVGQDPALNFNYNGLATIAEVQSACGAGCTYIGATGMEILDPYFHWMPAGIPFGVYDQIMFYEMGRSFWLFPQLQFTAPDDNGCFVTGFAVLMRERSIAAQGYQGGFSPPGSYSGANDAGDAATAASSYNALLTNTASLIDTYAADTSLNWQNTFLANKYSGAGGLGCTDLFASLITRLAQQNGGEPFIQSLWKEVLKRPIPANTQTAIDNFVLAASAAAGKNLTATFVQTWRWPVSDAAQAEAQSRWGSPI